MPYLESDLEQALVMQIEKFLLELGRGFMFVGTQQRITLNNTQYYVDMVFYRKIFKAFSFDFEPILSFSDKNNFPITFFFSKKNKAGEEFVKFTHRLNSFQISRIVRLVLSWFPAYGARGFHAFLTGSYNTTSSSALFQSWQSA